MKKIKEGKVRDIYDEGGNRLTIITSDRISAFDVILPNEIPLKGEILNKLSAFWFDYTKDIIPNHMLGFDGNQMYVKKLEMLPIECIVRGYITGGGWSSYQKTGKVCGIKLPEGLRESEKLPEPIFTPTTKADEGHDENISFEETKKIVGEELATKLRDKSIEIYRKCSDYAATKGIIIADTKFEFGLDESGVLTLGDEILTPDSSRFWPADKYELGKSQPSFDKQYIRDWLTSSGWNKEPPAPKLPDEVINITLEKYADIYDKITGRRIFKTFS